jgi:hypothetical protein
MLLELFPVHCCLVFSISNYRGQWTPSRAVGSATSCPLQLRAAWESPWVKYEKIYDTELGGQMEVAVRRAPPVKLVSVRVFAT